MVKRFLKLKKTIMKKYFHSDGREKEGPLTFEELKQEGINDETLIWFNGLEDWTQAKNLDEMKSILELLPPPIEISKKNLSDDLLHGEGSKHKSDPTKFKNKSKDINFGVQRASMGWIIFGFIFSILGGIIGIGMGFHYARGKYDSTTKTMGWSMVIIGFITMAIFKSI